MDKDMASQMLKAVLILEAKLGELDGLVSQLDDERERDEYAYALGNVIGIISENFVRRIVRQYPELDQTDKLKGTLSPAARIVLPLLP